MLNILVLTPFFQISFLRIILSKNILICNWTTKWTIGEKFHVKIESQFTKRPPEKTNPKLIESTVTASKRNTPPKQTQKKDGEKPCQRRAPNEPSLGLPSSSFIYYLPGSVGSPCARGSLKVRPTGGKCIGSGRWTVVQVSASAACTYMQLYVCSRSTFLSISSTFSADFPCERSNRSLDAKVPIHIR